MVAEIVPKAIQSMGLEFGTRPQDLEIAIGPGIGPCCFEVGPEVALLFQPFFMERNDLSTRTKVDLSETVIRQLRRNGVTVEQIATSALCSCCNAELFESYRRDRERAGRMISAVEVAES